MSEHTCCYTYGGARCSRPTAHSYYRATVIDGKEVEKVMHWMCEPCFQAFAKYAFECGSGWDI